MTATDLPALHGVRVLEVTQFEVGTVCGQQLAWLGAEVIKVEQPGVGDPARKLGPGFFASLNSSKRGITLDLKSDLGRRLFLELVERSDVVVENLAPGKFELLGLAYGVLRARNPRIVFARAKGFGTWGPHAAYKSFDFVAQATSGAMAATGAVDGPPMIERFPISDNATGIHLALGIMAALWQRCHTGVGQEVETTLQDAMISMGRSWFAHRIEDGGSPRAGNRFFAGGDLYPCAGDSRYDHVLIFCNPDRIVMWEGLFDTIGRNDLLERYRLGDPATRVYDLADEIDTAIVAWTSSRSKHEAMHALASAGVPAGAVLTAAEVLNDPHVTARGMVQTVNHPIHGELKIIGCPIKLAGSPLQLTSPPMVLGEDTDAVLSELGYSLGEIARFRNAGAL